MLTKSINGYHQKALLKSILLEYYLRINDMLSTSPNVIILIYLQLNGIFTSHYSMQNKQTSQFICNVYTMDYPLISPFSKNSRKKTTISD